MSDAARPVEEDGAGGASPDHGWDPDFDLMMIVITQGWEATPETWGLLEDFAIEFYERFVRLTVEALDARVGQLVMAGLAGGRPDLLDPVNAEKLAIEIYLPPALGRNMYEHKMMLMPPLAADKGER